MKGLLNLQLCKTKVCSSCKKGREMRMSHEILTQCSITWYFEHLYMDLMGPMKTESIGEKIYYFVMSWLTLDILIEFLKEKSETFNVFQNSTKDSKLFSTLRLVE